MEDIIGNLLKKFPSNRKDLLIPILQEIQKERGFLSKEALQAVGSYLNLPVNKIYGVASFYDQFQFKAPEGEVKTDRIPDQIVPLMQEELKHFLLDKILKNQTGNFTQEVQEKIDLLSRTKTTKPIIFVGTGTCGIQAGALDTIQSILAYLSSRGIDGEVVEVGCVGACFAEPLVDVQLPGKSRVSFLQVTKEKVEGILDGVFSHMINPEDTLGQYPNSFCKPWPNIPDLEKSPWFSKQRRIILRNTGIISPYSIVDYIVRGGYRSFYKTVLNYIPEKVCDIVEASELRGRSGSGFTTGKKWKLSLMTAGDEKYLICNADESNPYAYIDRMIIEGDPHRVIEGVAIASYAIGANNAYIHIRSNYSKAIEVLEEAIRQAKEMNIIGSNIFGSGFNLNIYTRLGAGAFVCGEETALIRSLEGKRAMPQSKPPYPAEIGLFGKPTIVNNVETLANIPTIIEQGPSWFKGIGIGNSKGTKVMSLHGKIALEGVLEIEMGTSLNEIIYTIGGGVKDGKQCKAVQVGGPLGSCIPEKLLGTAVGFEQLQEVGIFMRSGGLEIYDESDCMVAVSGRYMNFLQNESCGKCIPCREGTRRMLETINGITKRPKEEASHETLERFKGVVQIENLAEVMRDTSLCGLGQNAPNSIVSALNYFREEFEEHIFDRKCAANVCKDLRTFFIVVDSCTGCNICQRKCPENAIIGVAKSPHFIVEDKCTGCGICFEACKFNAILIK